MFEQLLHRIVWTEEEKMSIVVRAADELKGGQEEEFGLRLLRTAMSVLLPKRRRKLIAISQAPWFEGMVEKELVRRARLGGLTFEGIERTEREPPSSGEQFQESAIAMLALLYREIGKLRGDVVSNGEFCRNALADMSARL